MNQPPQSTTDGPTGINEPLRPLWKSAGVVGTVTLLSRICGLLRDSVTARYFGAGEIADAFFLAFRIPNLLRRLVAEGSLAAAFVPIFSASLAESPERAKSTLGEVTAFCLLLTGVLTVLCFVFAPEITTAFAPGFTAGGRFELTVGLLRAMSLYILLVSLLALASSALNSLGVFGIPAAAPIVQNISIITAVAALYNRLEQPVYALAYGVVLGGALSIVPQIYALHSKGYHLRLKNPRRSKAVRDLTRLMLPSIFSASVYQLMVLITSVLASFLGEGSIAWLYYADRLFQFPLGVFSLAVATTILPLFSRLAAENDAASMNALLKRSLGWISFISIPASAGLIVLSVPITRLCYEYREFQAGDTAATAQALIAFSVGLWGISCHSVVVRVFLAKKNTLLPALISCAAIVLNIILSLALMGPAATAATGEYSRLIIGLQSRLELLNLAHAGLALAGSIATMASFVALAAALPRVGLTLDVKSFLRSAGKAACGAAAMGSAVSIVTQYIDSAMLQVLFGVPFGAAIYLAATRMLGSTEARELVSEVKKFLAPLARRCAAGNQ